MAKDNVRKQADQKGANPFRETGKDLGGNAGQLNPSGPSTGTEGWGLGPGEAKTTRLEERMANPTGNNPSSGSQGSGQFSFRCSDVHPECNWQTSGRNEQELRQNIEQHARERHNLKELSEDTWNKVKSKFRRSAA